jgi:serine/threonine protein kinase
MGVNGRSNAGARAEGDRIGPYRLLEPLGEGGAAMVYRAVRDDSDRVVALKTVRATSEGVLASVRREIRALGRLRHPGIVNIFDGGVSEGRPWYAMELLLGRTLRDHLRMLWQSQALEATQETETPPGTEPTDTSVSALELDQPARSFPGQASWRASPKPPRSTGRRPGTSA